MSISTHSGKGFQISQPFSKIIFQIFHNSRNTLQETTEQSICRARPLVVARLPAHRAAVLPFRALQAPLKPPSLWTPDLLWDVRRHHRDLVQGVCVDGQDRAGVQGTRVSVPRRPRTGPPPSSRTGASRRTWRHVILFIDSDCCFHNCSSKNAFKRHGCREWQKTFAF